MNNVFTTKLGMGVALLSIAFATLPAHAQVAPGASSGTAYSEPAPTGGRIEGLKSLDDTVIVAGDPEDISRRTYEPVALRVMNQNDRVTQVTRDYWVNTKKWSTQSFDRMRDQNVHLCQKTGYFAMRFASLSDRYAAMEPRVAEMAEKYDKMRRKIKRASVFRTIGNVLTVGLSALVPGAGWAYGGMVATGALSNEVTGRASTKQQLLANEAGEINNELTAYHVEFNLLSLELYQDYLGMMVGYCTANETLASYDTAGAR